MALAIQLTRYGVPVRIVDMLAEPSGWSKALGIQARTLELFERMEIVERFLERGLRYRELLVNSEGKLIVHESLTGIRSRYNFVLALPQYETEAILTEHLRALGIAVERGTQLIHFEQDAGGVRAHLRAPDGEVSLECAYIVGCDGAHSTVRHLLDIPFTGEALSESFALADAKLDSDFPSDAISIFLSRGNIAAVFPLPGGITRLIIERADGFLETPSLDAFRSALYLGGGNIRSLSDPLWITQFTISQRRVSSIAKGRAFLAGDAAHVHSPIGAQGMNTGIQDVENLAWKLALTFKHGAAESVLASYAIERQAVAAWLVRATGAFTKIVASGNPGVRAVRDRLAAFATSIPMVNDRLRDAISELGIVYEKTPLVVAQGRTPDPRPGAHAPDAPLVHAGHGVKTSVFQLIASLRYVVLVFTYRRDQFVHEMMLAMQRHDSVLDAYIVARDTSVAGAQLLDPPGATFRAYDAQGEPQYVAIRPDGYVAARGALRDYRILVAYFDRILTPQAV